MIESTATPQPRGLFALAEAMERREVDKPAQVALDTPEAYRAQLAAAWVLFETTTPPDSKSEIVALLAADDVDLIRQEIAEARAAIDLSLSRIGHCCSKLGAMPFGIGGYGETNATVH